METIFVVDDDPEFRNSLKTILAGEGYAVEDAGSISDGIAAARRSRFDLLLTGLRMRDGDAPVLLGWFAENSPGTPAIAAVPSNDAAAWQQASKLGVDGLLAKPVKDTEALRRLVSKALARASVARERELLRQNERARFNDHTLVARDLKMLEALEKAGSLAALDAPVLIEGERATGKELVARWMHFAGPRAGRPFVAVESAPPPSAESFDRPGRVECAHGGTLYIDEVSELDTSAQLRLLQLLEDGVFETATSPRRIPLDVRVIASTSQNLKQLAAEGRFNEKVCELLCATSVTVPPLRERRSDIIPLARFFLARTSRELRKPEPMLTQGAEISLQLYEWPGNLRELANVIERVAITCRERVEPADVGVGMQAPKQRPLVWKEIERQAIEEALRMNGGNRTRAARQLGISLRTLQYRLKEWSAASHA